MREPRTLAVIRHPLAPMVTLSLAMSLALTGYLVLGATPSRGFEAITSALLAFALALWIRADAKRRRLTPCYDFGFLCYLTLPIATPWYCFWSRGWRGGLTLLLLIGLWLAPYLVAVVCWLVLAAV